MIKRALILSVVALIVAACSGAPSAPTATPDIIPPDLQDAPTNTPEPPTAEPTPAIPAEFDGPRVQMSIANDQPTVSTINTGSRWNARNSIFVHLEDGNIRVVFSVFRYTGDFRSWAQSQVSGSPAFETINGRQIAIGDSGGRHTAFVPLDDQFVASYGLYHITGEGDIEPYKDDVRYMAAYAYAVR